MLCALAARVPIVGTGQISFTRKQKRSYRSLCTPKNWLPALADQKRTTPASSGSRALSSSHLFQFRRRSRCRHHHSTINPLAVAPRR
jgi:hypothetical protein